MNEFPTKLSTLCSSRPSLVKASLICKKLRVITIEKHRWEVDCRICLCMQRVFIQRAKTVTTGSTTITASRRYSRINCLSCLSVLFLHPSPSHQSDQSFDPYTLIAS